MGRRVSEVIPGVEEATDIVAVAWRFPGDKGAHIVDTDASEAAVGALLSHIPDGDESPIAYFSRLYFRTEVNYCTTRKALLAVVEAFSSLGPTSRGVTFVSGPIMRVCDGSRRRRTL